MSLEPALIKQLELLPEVELLGVVGPCGVTGAGDGRPGSNEPWTVLITFSGWKTPDGKLRKSEMTVRKLVPEPQIQTFMAAMDPYDVVRVKARWSEKNVFGSPQALLTEFISKEASDSELNDYALELQEAVTFRDAQFGVFTLDRQVSSYDASTDWRGGPIRLTIPAETPAETEKALEIARQVWAEQDEWQRKVTACAIEKLLELKNDNWLSEDESEVSEEEFASRMMLESISVDADGTVEFWHNDGDLFWGHLIMVSGNLTDGPNDAGIHG